MTKECILSCKSKLRTSWPVLNQTEGFRKHSTDAKLKNSDTPDIVHLEHYNGHLVFAYGSMKAGFHRGAILEKASEFIAVATTNRPYSLFYDNNGKDENNRYPILLPPYNDSPAGFVVGQLWLVRPKTIMTMDDFERNGHLFKRIKLQLQIVSKPKTKMYQQYALVYAWTYVGVLDFWRKDVIDGKLITVERGPLFGADDRHAYLNWKKTHVHGTA